MVLSAATSLRSDSAAPAPSVLYDTSIVWNGLVSSSATASGAMSRSTILASNSSTVRLPLQMRSFVFDE